MPADALRNALGQRLERGGPGSPLTRLAASAWEAWSSRGVARPLRVPDGVRLVGVGGAVLGGAGKTPVAIALARAFAARGERTALIGHAYRARPGGPRRVRPGDPVGAVGDDALSAARLLDGAVDVIVAPRRQAAVDHAAALGHRLLIADALLQTAPRRLCAAVLVLDGLSAWGAGACPPLGDLRAPPAALLRAADVVAVIQPEGTALGEAIPEGAIPVRSRIAGAVSATGEHMTLDALGGLRLGVFLAVARADRIVSALDRAGLRPEVVVQLGDHAMPDGRTLARMGGATVDAWLTTARCATKLPGAVGGRPVLALDHWLDVTDLVRCLAADWGTGEGPC